MKERPGGDPGRSQRMEIGAEAKVIITETLAESPISPAPTAARRIITSGLAWSASRSTVRSTTSIAASL
jgi:hypothetical protein